MDKSIRDMLDKTAKWEGGWADVKGDRGGKTNRGITWETFKRHYPEGTVDDLKKLTKEQAEDIYLKDYFYGPGIDKLPPHIRDIAFDWGVTSGPSRVIKKIQRLAGVKADGIIGPNTLAAVSKLHPNDVSAIRSQHYNNIADDDETQEQFRKGWQNRTDDFWIEADGAVHENKPKAEDKQAKAVPPPMARPDIEGYEDISLEGEYQVPTIDVNVPELEIPSFEPGPDFLAEAEAMPEMGYEEQLEDPGLFQAPESIPMPGDFINNVPELIVEEQLEDPALFNAPDSIPLYDDPELDAYHRRNQTGLYGGGEMSLPGYAYGAMTNPEAGPSDTVPAMLTPGEAVIPASVAMDEDYKGVIKEMVDEGRKRNRHAESLGIPVNHPAVPGLADGALDAKISKIYNEGYTAPGQAYAIAKSKGYEGGTEMIPKPLGAPPKYNVAEPDHSRFNQAEMGQGDSMMMTNAKHKQAIANKQGAHAQKQDHLHESEMHKMQMANMKADQKLAHKMAEKELEMSTKLMEADVDSEVARRKQEALTTSMAGMGMVPPVAPPPSGEISESPFGAAMGTESDRTLGYAGGTKSAAQAQQINDLLKAGVSMEDIRKYLGAELGAVGDEFVSQPAPAPVAVPAPAAMPVPAAAPQGGGRMGALQGALSDAQDIALAAQRRQDATRDIARQAFGAEEEARAWQSGINRLEGRADGGEIQGWSGPLQAGAQAVGDFFMDPELREMRDNPNVVPPVAPELATTGALDQTDIHGFQNMLVNEGIATPEEAFVDPEYAAREARYNEQMAANQKAQAEQQVLAGQQAIEENKQAQMEAEKIAQDPTADPATRARAAQDAAQMARANKDNASNVAAIAGDIPVDEVTRKQTEDLANPNTPSTVNDGNTSEESAGAVNQVQQEATNDPEGWKATLGKVADWFGENIFSNDELITGAVVYGANKLLGYDDSVAMQQASKWALNNRQERKNAEAAAAQGQAAIEKYKQQKLIDASIKDPAAAKKLYRESVEKGRKHGEEVAKAALQNVGQIRVSEGGTSYNKPVITVTDKAAGGQFEKFLADITPVGATLDHNAPGVTQAMDNAVRAAVQYAKDNPGEDVTDLTPFLWASYIPESTGRGVKDFQGIDAKRMGELTSLVAPEQGKSRGQSIQNNFRDLQAAYAKLAQVDPKKFAEYEAKKPNGFYNFAREKMEMFRSSGTRGYVRGTTDVRDEQGLSGTHVNINKYQQRKRDRKAEKRHQQKLDKANRESYQKRLKKERYADEGPIIDYDAPWYTHNQKFMDWADGQRGGLFGLGIGGSDASYEELYEQYERMKR